MRDEVRADALLASLEQEHRGKLKVFLGAAPASARPTPCCRRCGNRPRRVDILIGVVETHGARRPWPCSTSSPSSRASCTCTASSGWRRWIWTACWPASPPSPWWTSWPTATPRQPPREALAGCGGVAGRRHRRLHHPQRAAPGKPQRSGVAADRGQGQETLPDQVLLEADSLVLIDLPKELLSASRRARSMCPIRPRPPCSPSSPSTT